MEPRKELSDEEIGDGRPSIGDGAVAYFRAALAFARRHYAAEMDHIAGTVFERLAPAKFFTEYVWVVHATGFNAKVVGKMMPKLEVAYGQWSSLGAETPEAAVERVRKVCNNPPKIRAVHAMASLMRAHMLGDGPHDIMNEAWEDYRDRKLSSPEKLQELPYIGKVTCYHLARNIGLLECVKPDLHLVRLARHWGFPDCVAMCRAMQEAHRAEKGEYLPLGIVDLVVWYACSTFGTLETRAEGDR